MKVFVLGNIGSGKSTTCDHLKRNMRGVELVEMDEFRKGMSDGTEEGEQIAREAFFAAVRRRVPLQVVSCTGVGPVGERLVRLLKKNNGSSAKIIFVLNTRKNTCLQRVRARVEKIPYPNGGKPVEDAVRKLDRLVCGGRLFELWTPLAYKSKQRKPNAEFVVMSNNNAGELRRNCEYLLDLVRSRRRRPRR
jgi:shikimate kinase